MVAARLPPDKLYKYRSLVGDSRGYLEVMLRDCRIYFASAADFNDPFDSKVHMTFGGSPTRMRNYLVGIFKRFRPWMTKKQRLDLATDLVRAKSPTHQSHLASRGNRRRSKGRRPERHSLPVREARRHTDVVTLRGWSRRTLP